MAVASTKPLLLAAGLLAIAHSAMAQEPINIGSRLEPLIDEHLIAEKTGTLRLRLHHPIRQDDAITLDKPWEGNNSAYATVLQHKGQFFFYYRGTALILDTKVQGAHYATTCVMPSRDGIHWKRMNGGKPVLEPTEINGQSESYVYNAYVLRDQGRYHMWYSSAQGITQNRYATNGSGIVYSVSEDGIHWTRDKKTSLFNGPRGSLDEYSCFAPCVVRRDDALFMYYSTGYLVQASDPRRFQTSLAIHYFDKQQSVLPVYKGHQDLMYYLDHDQEKVLVETKEDWMMRKHDVLSNMQQVTGPYAALQRSRSLDVRILEEKQVGELTRRKLTYRSDRNEPVTAYLFLPADRNKPAPAVLCLQQTNQQGKEEVAGISRDANLAYGLHLAQRGYVTLAPDYPGFGDSKFDFAPQRGYISGTMKAIFDNIRAVDLLESLPEVDGSRIGVIGHSLGGHNAMFTAPFEPRLKAIVSNCGFCRFHKDDVPSVSYTHLTLPTNREV